MFNINKYYDKSTDVSFLMSVLWIRAIIFQLVFTSLAGAAAIVSVDERDTPFIESCSRLFVNVTTSKPSVPRISGHERCFRRNTEIQF